MIRDGRLSDIDGIIKLCLAFHPRTNYAALTPDRQTMVDSITHLLSSRMGFVMVGQHLGKGITGVLAGQAVPYWFSREMYATDMVFLSMHSGDGVRMLRRFILWAWEIPRVKDISMAISSGIDVARTGRMLELVGFQNEGGLYTIQRPAAGIPLKEVRHQ